MPIVAVSSSKVDQTFVYSSAAIIRVVEEAGKFEAEILKSPIEARELIIFSRVS